MKSATGWSAMDETVIRRPARGPTRTSPTSWSPEPPLLPVHRRSGRALIWVDACYRDGLAAIAVTGDFGSHSNVLVMPNSMVAEAEALLLAMSIVRGAHARPVPAEFRTDCEAVARLAAGARVRGTAALTDRGHEIRVQLLETKGWRVRQVPRQGVREAHVLARRTLKEACGR